MTNDFSMNYQYDRCISRGICSINPATASLLEVILLYLKNAVFYELKLEESGIKDKNIRNLVLNTIAILSSNYEISETNFDIISSAFRTELPRIINEYESACAKQNVSAEKKDLGILLNENIKIYEYIRLGEKEFNNRVKKFNADERNMYKIIFILIKSLCINILNLESYEQEAEEEISTVLKTLNLLNIPQRDKNDLKDIIFDLSEKDCQLMIKIRNLQEKIYGIQNECEVSFSTVKGKALLVVGSNLRELEQILDKLKDKNIDVYTHDNMITAHTFSMFREYKNLKGQYGKGMENCLLDFSTFPGPIILTRYSLYNVENLYRGRLFTTDYAYWKGVIPIKNNDFSEVIKSAEESRGFKTGKKCESEKIGFSFTQAVDLIVSKASSETIKRLIIIGSQGYGIEEQEYFKNFTKHVPEDYLIISLSGCKEQENLICLNMRADTYGILRLTENILRTVDKEITLIFPHCDRHTLSMVLYLNTLKNRKSFMGKWNQTIINPNIADYLGKEFGIIELTTPKSDLLKII